MHKAFFRLTCLILLAYNCKYPTVAQIVSESNPRPSISHIHEGEYSEVPIDENSSRMEKISIITDNVGNQHSITNRYTILNMGMNYREKGQWKKSLNTIDRFPAGAVAGNGPHKAIFNSELNTPNAFDIESSKGVRFLGGVKALLLSDRSTGKSVVLASIKESVRGRLLPPNKVIYSSAFDNIDADVVYVWTHNSLSQNVILKESFAIPNEFDLDTTYLDVVTEVDSDNSPVIQSTQVDPATEYQDDLLIDWGDFTVLPGKAFGYNEDSNFELGHEALRRRSGEHVEKSLIHTESGRTFILESISVKNVAEELRAMQLRNTASTYQYISTDLDSFLATSKLFSPSQRMDNTPMELASYEPIANGLVIDLFVVTGNYSSYTFARGETYHLQGLVYIGSGSTTFQESTVLKYDNNAYLLSYGALYFPNSLQRPIFTSKDDDSYGEIVSGSTGSPTQMADPALMVYYLSYSIQIQNAWFQHCKTAIEFFSNPGSGTVHTVSDTLIQDSNIGVYADSYSSVYLSNTEKCAVTTPTSGGGSFTGTISNAFICTGSVTQAMGTPNPSASEPKDPHGAIGPNHYLEVINSNIAVYSRSGVQQEEDSLRDFFGLSSSIPESDIADPRAVYDPQCSKWIVTAMRRHSFGSPLLLAISKSSSPANLGSSSNWTILNTSLNEPNYYIDYPTIGFDSNGVYIVASLFNSGNTNWKYKLVAISKGGNCLSNVSSSNISVIDLGITGTQIEYTIQPAINYDTVGSSGVAWFVAKKAPSGSTPGSITYGKLKWISGTPTIVSGSWSSNINNIQDYYDLDGTSGFSPPQRTDGTTYSAINLTGSRLQMAVIRSGSLWTTHHVGVNNQGSYNGTPSNATRSAAQWIKLSVNTGAETLSYSQHGRIYDSSSSNPYWYYFPSLMVTQSGTIVSGFAASKSTEYIGAMYFWRKSSGQQISKPGLVQHGIAPNASGRWGDYTFTSQDPSYADRIWTVQCNAGTKIVGIKFPNSRTTIAELNLDE